MGKSGVPVGGEYPLKICTIYEYSTYMAHARNVGDMFL